MLVELVGVVVCVINLHVQLERRMLMLALVFALLLLFLHHLDLLRQSISKVVDDVLNIVFVVKELLFGLEGVILPVGEGTGALGPAWRTRSFHVDVLEEVVQHLLVVQGLSLRLLLNYGLQLIDLPLFLVQLVQEGVGHELRMLLHLGG